MAFTIGELRVRLGVDASPLNEATNVLNRLTRSYASLTGQLSADDKAVALAASTMRAGLLKAESAAAQLSVRYKELGLDAAALEPLTKAIVLWGQSLDPIAGRTAEAATMQMRVAAETEIATRAIKAQATALKEASAAADLLAAQDKILSDAEARVNAVRLAAGRISVAGGSSAVAAATAAQATLGTNIAATHASPEAFTSAASIAAQKEFNVSMEATEATVAALIKTQALERTEAEALNRILNIQAGEYGALKVRIAEANLSQENRNRLLAQATASEDAFRSAMIAAAGSEELAAKAASLNSTALAGLNRQLAGFTSTAGPAKRALSDIERGALNIGKAAEIAARVGVGPLSRFGGIVTGLSAAIKSGLNQFTSFAIGVSVAGVALYGLSNHLVEVTKANQMLTAQLEEATGASNLAKEAYDSLMRTSQDFGVNFQKTAGEFAKFAVSVKGTGITMKQSEEIFRGVTAASSALRLTTEETAAAFTTMQQMANKGTITWQNMRSLVREIPGSFEAMAKGMGMSENALRSLMKNGTVPSTQALVAMAQQLIKMYEESGKAAANANTLQGQLNTLHNTIFGFYTDLARTVEVAAQYSNTLKLLTDAFVFLDTHLATVIATLGGVFTALTAFYGIQGIIKLLGLLGDGFVVVAGAVIRLAASLGILNIAVQTISVGSIGGLLLKLGLVAASAIAGYYAFQKLKEGLTENHNKVQEAIAGFDDFIKKSKEAGGATADVIAKEKELANEYIKTAQAAVISAEMQVKAAQDALAAASAQAATLAASTGLAVHGPRGGAAQPGAHPFSAILEADAQANLTAKQKEAAAALKDLTDLEAKLAEIAGTKVIPALNDQAGETDKMRKAIEEANLKINEQVRMWEAILQGPAAVKAAERMNTIETAVEAMKNSLVGAKVPMEQIIPLLDKFKEAFTMHLDLAPITALEEEMTKTWDKLKSLKDGQKGYDEELTKFNELTPVAQEALLEFAKRAGHAATSIEDLAKKLAEAKREVADFGQAAKEIQKANDLLGEMQAHLNALQQGPSGSAAYDRMKATADSWRTIEEGLAAKGVGADKIAELKSQYMALAPAIDNAKLAMEGMITATDTMNSVIGDAQSALEQFFDTGTFDWRKMLQQISADITKLAVQEAIIRPLKDLIYGVPNQGNEFSSFGGLFGSLLGTAASAIFGSSTFGPSGGTYFGSVTAQEAGASVTGLGNIADENFKFASGGSFIVGGTGGTDTTPVSFMATPGEHVRITPRSRSQGGGSESGDIYVTVVQNIQTPDLQSFGSSRAQLANDAWMAAQVAARRNGMGR